jgi:C4-dicarboxylate transporter DctM subunit
VTAYNGLIVGLMAALFLVFGYSGVPVAFSLLAGVIIGTALTPVSLPSIITQLFNGIDSEALMAIPFFLLVGELMTSADVVVRIANLSQALVGHVRGGLAQVVTVFSMFFSGMSGSSSADVAVLSRTMARPMAEEGYDAAFVAALIAAAATIANLVPPSIMAVVYGAIGNVSIAGLFLGGIVPGLMVGFGLMIYCYFFGPPGFRRPRASLAQFGDAAKSAALPLFIPVILLGGILTGWFTPTEAGVIAIVYILVVVIPALNRRHLRRLPRDFAHAGLIYSLPLITIGAASAFGWMLAYLRGPIVVSGWIAGFAGNDPYKIMFALVALFVIVGDFIEPVPCIVIFMPIVATLTEAGGINSVHMGVVLIVTLAFGLITPPYGLALLMASKFVGVPFSRALSASLSIYVVFFVTIAVCIFEPEAVLFLPRHLFPESVGCFRNPAGAGYICPP